jgi:hypothetical protein
MMLAPFSFYDQRVPQSITCLTLHNPLEVLLFTKLFGLLKNLYDGWKMLIKLFCLVVVLKAIRPPGV